MLINLSACGGCIGVQLSGCVMATVSPFQIHSNFYPNPNVERTKKKRKRKIPVKHLPNTNE